MEARIYYREKSLMNRLIKQSLAKESDRLKTTSIIVNSFVYRDNSAPNLLYYKATRLSELEFAELPFYLKGLKIVKITLHEVLSLEQNSHIRQGEGRSGDTRYHISYNDRKFEAPTGSSMGWAYRFRAVIEIWIRGINLQSVTECYRKIRKGEIDFKDDWKGEVVVPSHCKENVLTDTEDF